MDMARIALLMSVGLLTLVACTGDANEPRSSPHLESPDPRRRRHCHPRPWHQGSPRPTTAR